MHAILPRGIVDLENSMVGLTNENQNNFFVLVGNLVKPIQK